MTIRRKATRAFLTLIETFEREECTWCGAVRPETDAWVVADFEDSMMGQDPMRFCSPRHAVYLMTALADENNSPNETVDDIEHLHRMLKILND